MFICDKTHRNFVWQDDGASFSFRIVGKPAYLPETSDSEECLYAIAEEPSGNRFAVYFFRLTPDEWDWENPDW